MKLQTAKRLALSASTAAAFVLAAPGARAADQSPIKIGVVTEASAVLGKPIPRGVQLAVDAVNAKGGINGRKVEVISYDDHSSAADAVRAYQRLVEQDHVNVVVATFPSEIALALEPWAARLHMPTITPGAVSNLITKQVHDDYSRYKYMFQGTLSAPIYGEEVCDSSHQLLVEGLHMKTAAIVREDADWTKPLNAALEKCLPKAGLKIVDKVVFNPDTSDFTPIFNEVESKHPDVMIMGIGHVGVQPTVQWAAQQMPIPMAGISAQASGSTFWKSTHGATEGVITQTSVAPGVALTPITRAVEKAYVDKYHVFPQFTGFTAYDDAMAFLQAIQRAHSTNPDKIVTQMENTDMVGSTGRIGFYGRKSPFTHGLRYGPDWVTGTFVQWQHGKQVCVWPVEACPSKLEFPAFVKLPR